MQVAIVASSKNEEIQGLQAAFEKDGFEKAPFVKISKIGLFTKGTDTRIIFGDVDFAKYGGVFLDAPYELVQFSEPFLDELVEKGIYCQAKPESQYITSNKPLLYATLSSRQVPLARTTILGSPALVEQLGKGLEFPLLFKVFVGQQKTQEVVVESERNLRSMSRSIKTNVDAITLQEYFGESLDYCFVVGREIITARRGWDAGRHEHRKRPQTVSLSAEDISTARRATKICGLDIATVKMIKGKVVNVSPHIEFERFNKVLGKDLYRSVALHYKELLVGVTG